MIRQIRNRAWGNLEMGATMIDLPADMLNTQTVEVPDAETYYTSYKAAKGYTSPVWKVALIIERRHEFNAEFSLYHDLCRMGMCKDGLPPNIRRQQPTLHKRLVCRLVTHSVSLSTRLIRKSSRFRRMRF